MRAMNPLLYGHNPEERIVAVHQKDDRAMRLYHRERDGVRISEEPFYPFFHLSDRRYLDGFARKHWVRKLDGSEYFQYLCAFDDWSVLWEAVRHVIDTYNRSAVTKVSGYGELEILHLVADPAAHYLLQTGKTLFKGLAFEELHRMQLDIETYTTSPHRFSNARREGDRIILIALSDSRGWEHLIDGKKLTEKEMLRDLVRIIGERDPDVIEGHNIFNFDLPYILQRCALHNITPAIGRGGAPPRSFETRMAFADQPFDYTAADLAGRHIVDTLLLVQQYDATKRTMESYGLKYAAQYFGFSSAGRTYISGDRIAWHWDHDVRPLMDYAMDDVRETAKLSEHLSGTSFYLSQMIPFNYGTVMRMGAAAKIESLMLREYVRAKHAIPRPREGTQTTGGYTDIYVVGIVGPIVHADVESLYPSIMISRGIRPAGDSLGVFPALLGDLTATRLAAKRKMQGVMEPLERSRLDAMQSSLKILINSFYGSLGYRRALFNDYGQADLVTKTGQQILRQMIAFIQERSGKVIEVDTDGIFFVPPAGVNGEEGERSFVAELSARLPDGITVSMDGRYGKMFSYKKKNYALLGYDDKIRIKGSSLISRSMEQFGRTYIHQCIDYLLNQNIGGVHALYLQMRQALLDHALDARDFSRVESLKDPVSVYLEEVSSGKRNKSAAYEVALSTGRPIKPGDRIAYYITGNDPNAKSFENCKSADEWDPHFPDENTHLYLRRLDEFSEKFAPLFHPRDFRAIFSAEGLFPFDAATVALLVTDLSPGTAEAAEERAPQDFDIWIDE